MFAAAKDRLAGEAARAYLNGRMRRYGRIEQLRLDSRERRIALDVRLEGEAEPISVEVLSYRLEASEGPPRVTVLAVKSSRPWIELALAEHVVGRAFPLPAWAAAAL
jgi:hypothetical protein